MQKKPEVENESDARPFEKTIVINVWKNESAVVAAEEVICQRINIESTNKFKIME